MPENVKLRDLFGTLCELCDSPIPEGLDSRSLMPLLQGGAENWDNESINQTFDTRNTRNLMIKRKRLKFQYFREDVPELLFDLERDPKETQDFLHDSAYVTPLAAFRRRRDELDLGHIVQPITSMLVT